MNEWLHTLYREQLYTNIKSKIPPLPYILLDIKVLTLFLNHNNYGTRH